MISDLFITDVINVIETYRRSMNASFYIPDLSTFKELINIAFFTSLKKEEGASVDFRLVIIDNNDLHEFVVTNRVLEFDTYVPLGIGSLVKVAPAHDAVQSALVVSINEISHELNIIGFMPVESPSSNSVLQILNDNELVKSIPENIIISAPDSGLLKISVANTDIGRMVDGRFILSSPSYLTDLSLGFHLKKSILTHELYTVYGKIYWDIYKAILIRILNETAIRGHGATIVLLDSTTASESSDYYEPRYKFTNILNLNAFIQKVLADGVDSTNSLGTAKIIIDNIMMLAQLATVDGALIMTNNLEFYSFGATLKAPQWDGIILTGSDGFGKGAGNVYSANRLGTRHNSAIAFAGNCKECCVFVISHDGPIRAFMSNSEDAVVCWPDCSL